MTTKMAAVQLMTSFVLLLVSTSCAIKHPHIVFTVIDDMGWNDIGFNNPNIISPNLNKLAREGVILNQTYVQPLCSPSRAAFMTGYYPYRLGLQHLVILNQQAVCVPTNMTLLPQYLKGLGYVTHMVGKWHGGFCNLNCTPTFRGFDSFLGYYNAEEDYYIRTSEGYYDFRDNTTLSVKKNNTYSTFVFQERIREIIDNHDINTPLFLYLPLQSVHRPLQVPKEYYDMYPGIQNEDRRVFSGMVTALDDVIGNMTSFLTQRGMLENTLFFVTSDNGGWTQYAGNNWPLRGGKFTIWEGGARVVAFASGVGLHEVKGTSFEGMMHAVDFLPTIVSAAGGQVKDNDMDGISIWNAIQKGLMSPRTEFIYNLDESMFPLQGRAGIRQGDYKLLIGFPGLYSGWYPPVNSSLEACANLPQNLEELMLHFMNLPEVWNDRAHLYNLKDDPTEHYNLAEQMPDVVAKLKARMAEYMKKYVPPNFPPFDPASDPRRYGNAWSPGWC